MSQAVEEYAERVAKKAAIEAIVEVFVEIGFDKDEVIKRVQCKYDVSGVHFMANILKLNLWLKQVLILK